MLGFNWFDYFFHDSLRELFWAISAFLLVAGALYFLREWFFVEKWHATFTSRDKTTNEEDIKLASFFGMIWGRSTCRWTELDAKNTRQIVTYKILGRRKDRTIRATYIATKRKSLDMGVFIVRINAGWTEADGIITSYDNKTGKQFEFADLDACVDYHWEKV